MTRLTEKDLAGLDNILNSYDLHLYNNFGLTLKSASITAAGISKEYFDKKLQEISVAVIPVTMGQGIIGNFSYTVKSILQYVGANVFITESYDVAGIAEGINRGANLLFMADDNQFIALNNHKGIISDNAEATARGFVTALNAAAKGLENKEVLLIGAGKVGSFALEHLNELDAKVAVYDIDNKKLEQFKQLGLKIETNINEALNKYKYIFDASPMGDFIDLDLLHPEVYIAAPGMPLGLTKEAYKTLNKRVIHDPLQLGVATMLAMAL